MAILTKSQILQGVNTPKQVKIESLDGELWLRPLSSAELDEASYVEAKGMGNIDQQARSRGQDLSTANVNQNNKFNVEKVTRAQDEAKYQMIFASLDNPKNESDPWSLEDIKQLQINVTDEILFKVRELSGVEVTKRDVKKFPSN